MTGGGNNGMTFIKNIKLGLLTSIIMPAVGITFSVQAAMTDSVTVTLNSTFTNPTCTLDAPKLINLGTLPVNMAANQPFDIDINCPTSVKTAIYATADVSNGHPALLPDSDSSGIIMGGDVIQSISTLFVWLFLEHNGTRVIFNAPNILFCEGDNNRTCSILPLTRRHSQSIPGIYTARVVFTVKYI